MRAQRGSMEVQANRYSDDHTKQRQKEEEKKKGDVAGDRNGDADRPPVREDLVFLILALLRKRNDDQGLGQCLGVYIHGRGSCLKRGTYRGCPGTGTFRT